MGDRQKPPRTKPCKQKTPDKPLGKKSPRINPCRPTLERHNFFYVCMHVLLKVGVPRCVTYFRGPRFVTKCDREERGQNWSKIAWRTLSTAPACICISTRGQFPDSKNLGQ